MSSVKLQYQHAIEKLAKERGCSRRTAARVLREQSLRSEMWERQAVQVAAHVDWSNQTDIASEIREMADLIKYHGVKCVSNAERDRVLRNISQSVQIAKD